MHKSISITKKKKKNNLYIVKLLAGYQLIYIQLVVL